MPRIPTLAGLLLFALLTSRLAAQSDSTRLVQLNRGYVDAFTITPIRGR